MLVQVNTIKWLDDMIDEGILGLEVKRVFMLEGCKECEHTPDECKKCYPELGYKNTKMERDSKTVQDFSKEFLENFYDESRFSWR